jgi:hypothetical protein
MAGSWDGTTSGILFTDRRDFYINPHEVAMLYSSVAPFTAYSSMLPMIQSADPDYKMFEADDHFVAQKFLVNDGDGASWSSDADVGETAQIAAADNFVALKVGDNLIGLECEIRDNADNSLKSISVITAHSGGAITFKHLGNPEASNNLAVAIEDNDIVYVIGNVRAEGDTSPTAWSTQPRVVWNSAQIQKTPLQVTGTLLKAALRGGWNSELARLRVQKGMEHAIQKERSFLYGMRADGNGAPSAEMLTDGTSGQPMRSTLGVIPALNKYGLTTGSDQNVFSITAGNYDYDQFVDDSGKWFEYNPAGRLTLMAGQDLINFFHKIEAGNGFLGNSNASIEISHRETGALGYSFREVHTPSGVVELVYNPTLRYYYSGHGILLAPDTIQRVQYRANEYQAGIQANDADYVKDQYFSDEGIMITNLKRLALLKLA